jgi:hypothetical protein
MRKTIIITVSFILTLVIASIAFCINGCQRTSERITETTTKEGALDIIMDYVIDKHAEKQNHRDKISYEIRRLKNLPSNNPEFLNYTEWVKGRIRAISDTSFVNISNDKAVDLDTGIIYAVSTTYGRNRSYRVIGGAILDENDNVQRISQEKLAFVIHNYVEHNDLWWGLARKNLGMA